jgi:serine/threonine protein kinase
MHQLGFIHRDVKPDNIFVVQAGDAPAVAKLGDFGLSVKTAGAGDDSAAATPRGERAATPRGERSEVGGDVGKGRRRKSGEGELTCGVGTSTYSSPELEGGGARYDAKVDMFALGVVMVELLCPFNTRSERAHVLYTVRTAVAQHPPPPAAPHLPGGASAPGTPRGSSADGSPVPARGASRDAPDGDAATDGGGWDGGEGGLEAGEAGRRAAEEWVPLGLPEQMQGAVRRYPEEAGLALRLLAPSSRDRPSAAEVCERVGRWLGARETTELMRLRQEVELLTRKLALRRSDLGTVVEEDPAAAAATAAAAAAAAMQRRASLA